jgi:hypothetical protein
MTLRFTAGPALVAGRDAIVPRPEAREVEAALARGGRVLVIGPRRTGKTTLARGVAAAWERVLRVDLGPNPDKEQWIGAVLSEARRLGLAVEAGARPSVTLEWALLAAQQAGVPVLFDELNQLAIVEDGDACLEVIARAASAPCLASGVIDPRWLGGEERTDLFAQWRVVWLGDLDRADLLVLDDALEGFGVKPAGWADAIYSWTSGHPYLTMLMYEAAAEDRMPPGEIPALRVQRLIDGWLRDAGRLDLFAAEIQSLRRRDERVLREAMLVWLELLSSRRIPLEPEGDPLLHKARRELWLLGLARRERDHLVPRARVLEERFDAAWTHDQLRGVDRPFLAEMTRWLTSGRRERELPHRERMIELVNAAPVELTGTELAFFAACRAELRRLQVARLRQWLAGSFVLLLLVVAGGSTLVMRAEVEAARAEAVAAAARVAAARAEAQAAAAEVEAARAEAQAAAAEVEAARAKEAAATARASQAEAEQTAQRAELEATAQRAAADRARAEAEAARAERAEALAQAAKAERFAERDRSARAVAEAVELRIEANLLDLTQRDRALRRLAARLAVEPGSERLQQLWVEAVGRVGWVTPPGRVSHVVPAGSKLVLADTLGGVWGWSAPAAPASLWEHPWEQPTMCLVGSKVEVIAAFQDQRRLRVRSPFEEVDDRDNVHLEAPDKPWNLWRCSAQAGLGELTRTGVPSFEGNSATRWLPDYDRLPWERAVDLIPLGDSYLVLRDSGRWTLFGEGGEGPSGVLLHPPTPGAWEADGGVVLWSDLRQTLRWLKADPDEGLMEQPEVALPQQEGISLVRVAHGPTPCALVGAARGALLIPDLGAPEPSVLTLSVEAPAAAAFSDDGELLVTATSSGGLQLWDSQTGAQLLRREIGGAPTLVGVDGDLGQVWAAYRVGAGEDVQVRSFPLGQIGVRAAERVAPGRVLELAAVSGRVCAVAGLSGRTVGAACEGGGAWPRKGELSDVAVRQAVTGHPQELRVRTLARSSASGTTEEVRTLLQAPQVTHGEAPIQADRRAAAALGMRSSAALARGSVRLVGTEEGWVFEVHPTGALACAAVRGAASPCDAQDLLDVDCDEEWASAQAQCGPG